MDLRSATKFINEKGNESQKAKFNKYLQNASDNEDIEKELFKSGIDKGAPSGDPFYTLIAMCSSYSLSARVLHHHITGLQGWFENHPKLADIYGEYDDLSDWLIETYISLGGTEPSTEMSLEIVPTEEVRDHTTQECFKLIYDYDTNLIKQMDIVKKDLPDYLASEMESKQAALHTEAEYMIKQALKSEE